MRSGRRNTDASSGNRTLTPNEASAGKPAISISLFHILAFLGQRIKPVALRREILNVGAQSPMHALQGYLFLSAGLSGE